MSNRLCQSVVQLNEWLLTGGPEDIFLGGLRLADDITIFEFQCTTLAFKTRKINTVSSKPLDCMHTSVGLGLYPQQLQVKFGSHLAHLKHTCIAVHTWQRCTWIWHYSLIIMILHHHHHHHHYAWNEVQKYKKDKTTKTYTYRHTLPLRYFYNVMEAF